MDSNLKQFLFSFEGRINRGQYWMFFGPTLIIFSIPYMLYGIENEQVDSFIGIVSLLFAWPSLALQVKRWHDRDRSGWWILVNFIPVIGFFWALIENGFLPGDSLANRYG